jgi:glycosyltransferase involved in cell wall biosynthesis
MRVLFVVHQYAPHWIGGTEILVQQLTKRLLATGHEPSIVTYHESASRYAQDFGIFPTEVDGVRVYELRYNLSCDPEPSLAEYDNARTASWLDQLIVAIKPDVAHVAHGMKVSGAVYRTLRRRSVPIVTTLSDYWFICMRHTLLRPGNVLCSGPDHRYRCLRCAGITHRFGTPLTTGHREPWLWLVAAWHELRSFVRRQDQNGIVRDIRNVAHRKKQLRSLLLQADRIVALSNFQKGMYVRNGFPGDRISVIGHAGYRQPASAQSVGLRKSQSCLRIISIGTLAEFKGAHVLVDAMGRVPALDCELVLYGAPGPDAAYVDRLRRAASEDRRIRLPGTFPPADIGKVLMSASILAHPAIWYENNPLVVQDALAAGVPVVASDLGSLTELVGPVAGCTLLPAGDVDAWAAWLGDFVDREPPQPITPPNLPRFEDFFERMMEIYNELADEAHRRRVC